MNFKSEHEAYTYILLKQAEVKRATDNVQTDIDFLFMNIQKGNFKDAELKIHALKELDYLTRSAQRLAFQASELSRMAKELHEDLTEAKPAEKVKPEFVFNGIIKVPNIRIEYRGFTIEPKLDMGEYPWASNGNTYSKGYVVTRDDMAIMPGATWSHSVVEAKVAIDSFIEANEDGQKFWEIMHEKQGRMEWTEV